MSASSPWMNLPSSRNQVSKIFSVWMSSERYDVTHWRWTSIVLIYVYCIGSTGPKTHQKTPTFPTYRYSAFLACDWLRNFRQDSVSEQGTDQNFGIWPQTLSCWTNTVLNYLCLFLFVVAGTLATIFKVTSGCASLEQLTCGEATRQERIKNFWTCH